MKRAYDARFAEVPHLGVRAQRKVKLAQRDYTPHEAACELPDERAQHLYRLGRDGLCDVLGRRRVQTGVQSKPRQRRQLPRRRRMERENAPHEASECTEVEQVHTIRAQVLGIDPEALELALDLIRPGIAACTCSSRSLCGRA
jgi:hypothetical protein